MTANATESQHDNLAFPQNNLLDGREYETVSLLLLPDQLRRGDIVSTGVGVYQVGHVGNWSAGTDPYIRHISITHTLVGPVQGGLLRGTEYLQVLGRRRVEG